MSDDSRLNDEEQDVEDPVDLQEENERLRIERDAALNEALVCRECFSGLRDLVVACGYQVLPNLSAFQPLRARLEALDEMRWQIRQRLNEEYARPKE